MNAEDKPSNIKHKLTVKSKIPTSSGGFEESKASEIEHDDFFNPKTAERREKKIQEKNRRLAERKEAKNSDKWQSMSKQQKNLNDNIMIILEIDKTERKGENKESWQKLGDALIKSRRKKAAKEQLTEDYREAAAATKIQSKYRQNKAMKQQQQLNLVPLGEQALQIR